MKTCERFENEGLPALERGEPLDPHIEGCADCRAALAAYRHIEADLAALGQEDPRPPGIDDRVWARIHERQAPARPWYRRWWWLALPAPALAAALLFLWLERPGLPVGSPLQVRVVPGHTAAPVRSDAARPGDRLVLRARADARAELRVYRGHDELVLRCATEPPCQRRDDVLHAEIALPARGDYHVLLLSSEAPAPAPLPDLGRDIAAAEEAGARIERHPVLVVR